MTLKASTQQAAADFFARHFFVRQLCLKKKKEKKYVAFAWVYFLSFSADFFFFFNTGQCQFLFHPLSWAKFSTHTYTHISENKKKIFFFSFNTGQCQFLFHPLSWAKFCTHTHTHTYISENKKKKDFFSFFIIIKLCFAFSSGIMKFAFVASFCRWGNFLVCLSWFFSKLMNFDRVAITFIVLWYVPSTCTHYHIQVLLFRQYLLQHISFGLTYVILSLIGLALALNVNTLKICINLYRLFLVLA